MSYPMIVWFMHYDPNTDVCMALPAKGDGAIKPFLDNGIVKLISANEANEINSKSASRGFEDAAVVYKALAMSWRIIAERAL